ncbi:MAG: SLBB domain-containing protein [Deltaproteobacteria bacterium]|nr:SLBB domain-containing protein [Deltaproteobacteria bacterium]
MKKIAQTFLVFLIAIFFTNQALAQEGSPTPAAPAVPIASPGGASSTPAAGQQVTPTGGQQITPQQLQILNQLTPSQKQAVQSEAMKSGGKLTPEAIEAMKARPEFKGLTPEDIAKGKAMLEQKGQETAGKEEAPPAQEKQVLEAEAETEGKSLFEQARTLNKYQDVSLDLKRFGYDFFKQAAVSVITERKDIPVPLKYIIGPGDEVKIMLWGRVNAQYDLTVDRDGKITVPQIGPLYVAGMTFEDMTKHVIQQSEQIVGTNVDVSMGSLKTIPVFVLGDVRRPGSYTIGSFATMTDALMIAGGPTGIGSMRNIQLKRQNKIIATFDLYNLLLKGDKSKDLILQAGDIVFVPVTGPQVAIAGNIKRPAIYELKDQFDLQHLFDLAGGIIPTAYTQQIQVERIIKNEKRIVFDIDDKNLEKTQNVLLQEADLVKVFSIVDIDVNAIYLHGNVKRPGKYEYKPGMRLMDIVKSPDDLLPETYFEYALIKRLVPPSMEQKLIPFRLEDLFLEGNSKTNPELMPQDNIYLFNKWFFQDKVYFTVSGEVRNGGRYPLLLNYRVKDAILAAGNLTKEDYLQKGEIIRVDEKKQYYTLYFDVAKAMADDPDENLTLMDDDRIIIHSIWEEKWKETVMITGEVKNPGTFTRTEEMRVSDLLFKAGGQTRDTLLDDAELYRTDWKTKEVTLLRIDLGKALAGDPLHNRPLKDLDLLVIHSVWEKVYKYTVAVDGDVAKPGTYRFAENMTVRDLVFAAGSITESAYIEEAELSSLVTEDRKITKTERQIINLRKALEGDPDHNLRLRPYDRLFVRKIPKWGVQLMVSVSGEVRFPGRYTVHKGEKLSSLLERAGGYTPDAYLRGAVFARQSVKKLQQEGLEDMAKRMERDLLSQGSEIATSLSIEEIKAREMEIVQKRKFIETFRQLEATGRMTIRLANLRLLKDSEYDIELEDSDSLHIPPKNNVVNVMGSVMAQASYIYLDELTYKDYIEMAGGYTRHSDPAHTFVLKVDGSARKLERNLLSWSDNRSRWEISAFGEETKEIEPGDVIVVPEKLEHVAWLREIRDITQILMNTAVTAGVVIKLF